MNLSRSWYARTVDRAAELIAERLLAIAHGTQPVIVAIDGRSGVGKSTVSPRLAARTGGSVIKGDDFYSGGAAEEWDAMTPAEIVMSAVDWHRQREVLSTLRRGRSAAWRPYDWNADDGRLASHPLSCQPQRVVILEGIYSARPELSNLLDLRVLLYAPRTSRVARLRSRDGERLHRELDARWASAERYYFSTVMPPSEFDLIVRNAAAAAS